jgi:hypothetical protein
MELEGGLVALLGGLELGGVCAPARALTAKVARAIGSKYVFISTLL